MEKMKPYAVSIFIPLLLTGVFVAENQAFNIFLGLEPNIFWARLFSSTFALGMLFYGASVFLKPTARYIYSFAVSLFFAGLFSAQYLYHSYSESYLQASAIKYAGQAGDELPTIIRLASPKLLVFFACAMLAGIMFFLSRKKIITEIILTGKQKAAIGTIIIFLVLFGYRSELGGDLRIFTNPGQFFRSMNSFVWSPNDRIKQIGIINYSISDMIGLVFRNVKITADDIQFVKAWAAQNPTPPEGKYFGAAKGRNLIIIQVESLENAVMGQKVEGQEITPNLNRLAASGLYFNNYYTQIGPGNTADAEFVTLNSLYPLSNEVAFIGYANNKYFALPYFLKQNGYNTYVLHGDVPTFWNRANIYPALGYETIISKKDFVPVETNFPTLSDDDFLTQSAEKMKTFKRPFMATLITLSSHTPFEIPEEYQKLSFSDDTTLNDTQEKYLESVHYTDAAIGDFILKLKQNGLYNDSLIVIYGDHGSFTDISSVVGNETKTTSDLLRKSQVPLIILAPGTGFHATETMPGSHLDLYPTVAKLLGIVPPRDIFGQDLLSTETPIETRRDPDSQAITAILTKTLEYEASDDGLFENGKCVSIPSRKVLSIEKCQELFKKQLEATQASDLIIRGNLMPVEEN